MIYDITLLSSAFASTYFSSFPMTYKIWIESLKLHRGEHYDWRRGRKATFTDMESFIKYKKNHVGSLHISENELVPVE